MNSFTSIIIPILHTSRSHLSCIILYTHTHTHTDVFGLCLVTYSGNFPELPSLCIFRLVSAAGDVDRGAGKLKWRDSHAAFRRPVLGLGRCGDSCMLPQVCWLTRLVRAAPSPVSPPVLIRYLLHQLAQVLSQLNVCYQQVTWAIKVEMEFRFPGHRHGFLLSFLFIFSFSSAVSLAGL